MTSCYKLMPKSCLLSCQLAILSKSEFPTVPINTSWFGSSKTICLLSTVGELPASGWELRGFHFEWTGGVLSASSGVHEMSKDFRLSKEVVEPGRPVLFL